MRRSLLASLLLAALVLPGVLQPDAASADLAGLDEEEVAAIEALNEIRVDLGLSPLALSPILTDAAEWMAQDLADRDTIDHDDSLGRPMADRVYSFDYPTSATIRENLVVGTDLDRGVEAITAWQDSPGHRTNNEAPDVTVAGIARVHDPDSRWQWFWVLNLGSFEDPGTLSTAALQQEEPPTDEATGEAPVGTEPGTFSIDFPPTGIGLTAWNGGTLAQMAEGARVGGARSMFITVEGTWVVYNIGAPEFVNANFAARFPSGEVPSGTVLLIVK